MSTFEHVLGIGSAFGEELAPVLDRTQRVTILEPADGFTNGAYRYVKPNPSGIMPFTDKSFDLITCFGVLHHIPNVTRVIHEIARCLKPGGYLLLREPTHSMGNWDQPRPGLTRRERGIPIQIMRRILGQAGLGIVHQRWCMFPTTAKSQALLRSGQSIYNLKWITALDDLVSNLPWWSHAYHAKNVWQRFRPWSVFLILRKDLRSN
jgi:SAM-dependent methyltransferase